MENLSLTYFIDFVMRSGPAKVTVVRDFKNRPPYDPRVDFYKPLRDRLVSAARSGEPLSSLQSFAGDAHENKRAAYLACVAGIKKAFGRKQLRWFTPPKVNYSIGAVTLNVNPELGLEIAGVPHVIKVYFKDEPELSKRRIQLVNFVLEASLSDPQTPQTFAVLDARKGRIYSSGTSPSGLGALLAGEAASFGTMFNAL